MFGSGQARGTIQALPTAACEAVRGTIFEILRVVLTVTSLYPPPSISMVVFGLFLLVLEEETW